MKREHIILGAASVLSLAVGSASGFFVAKKKLEAKYVEIAEQEIAEAKQFYSKLYKKEEFETPQSTIEALGLSPEAEAELTEVAQVLKAYQGKADTGQEVTKMIVKDVQIHEIEVETDVEEHNVFENSIEDDDFDYNEELQHRDPDHPYVISQEEFLENEPDYQQSTITFYEADDVLADERDQAIEDIEMTVGHDSLQKFGHGSKDPNVVYVRNDRINLDFEILRSRGSFTREVLGFIEHSDRRGLRRFRGDDD